MTTPQLTGQARSALEDPTAWVYVSAASIWEIAIKVKLGKFDLGEIDPIEEIAANDFLELPVTARHAHAAGSLPRHHDDPFDRMLIAQARLEDLVLVSHDGKFKDYGVQLLST